MVSRNRSTLLTFIFLVLALNSIPYAQPITQNLEQRKTGSLKIEPYKLKSEGQEIEAELGRLIVKESRRDPKSRLIELAFVRLKSTAANPSDPVVYLDGGLGSSAINIALVPRCGLPSRARCEQSQNRAAPTEISTVT